MAKKKKKKKKKKQEKKKKKVFRDKNKLCLLNCSISSLTMYNYVIRLCDAYKAVSHVINSRALTGEKPCINKTNHALLMHGYATFNMLAPGRQNSCRHEICSAWP